MMNRLFFAFFFLYTTTISAAERSASLQNIARVTVHKSSGVTGSKVYLKDIARFSNLPTEAEKFLGEIVVATEIEEKNEIRLTSFTISEKFREPLSQVQKKYGIRVMFSVPPEVTIRSLANAFTPEVVESRLVTELQKSCELCKFELTNLRLPVISKKLINADWKIMVGSAPIKGVFSLPVSFQGSFSTKNTYWISGRVVRKQRVPIATRRLDPTQRVREGDFKMAYRDVTYAVDGIPSAAELVGKKLRRGILIDHVIWRTSIEKKKAIRFGDPTEVIVGKEGWQIKATAIAQENADIGDRIRLLNPKTRKFISGTVVGERLVRIR